MPDNFYKDEKVAEVWFYRWRTRVSWTEHVSIGEVSRKEGHVVKIRKEGVEIL